MGILPMSSMGIPVRPRAPKGGPKGLPMSSTGILPVSSMGILPVSSTGILPVSSMGILPVSSMGILPVSSTGILPVSSTGILPVSRTGILPVSRMGILPMSRTGILPVNSLPVLAGMSRGCLTRKNLRFSTVAKPCLGQARQPGAGRHIAANLRALANHHSLFSRQFPRDTGPDWSTPIHALGNDVLPCPFVLYCDVTSLTNTYPFYVL
jgi:hypothetical protein